MARPSKYSPYVIEEQSRGTGAVATEDLGQTAQVAGGEIISRKRSSGGFPGRSFQFRQGYALPEPSRKVVAKARVPVHKYATRNYNQPDFRDVEVPLVSRPGGARVTAGVILGDPPSEMASTARRVHPSQGVYSAVHTPKGPTLQQASAMGQFPVQTISLDPSSSEELQPSSTKMRVDPGSLDPGLSEKGQEALEERFPGGAPTEKELWAEAKDEVDQLVRSLCNKLFRDKNHCDTKGPSVFREHEFNLKSIRHFYVSRFPHGYGEPLRHGGYKIDKKHSHLWDENLEKTQQALYLKLGRIIGQARMRLMGTNRRPAGLKRHLTPIEVLAYQIARANAADSRLRQNQGCRTGARLTDHRGAREYVFVCDGGSWVPTEDTMDKLSKQLEEEGTNGNKKWVYAGVAAAAGLGLLAFLGGD